MAVGEFPEGSCSLSTNASAWAAPAVTGAVVTGPQRADFCSWLVKWTVAMMPAACRGELALEQSPAVSATLDGASPLVLLFPRVF